MSLDKYRLKLQKYRDAAEVGGPQFTLRYKARSDNPKHVSHSILTPLFGNDDVIILLSTEFFQNAGDENHSLVGKFVENARQLGLFVVERSRPKEQKVTLFGFPSKMKKKVEVLEAAAYVPNRVWKDSFRDIVPMCGARYYVLQQMFSIHDFMSGIFDMTEEEIAKTFLTSIFDLAAVGQMGISSNIMDQSEISRRLGIE
jgi:hypothetical protein